MIQSWSTIETVDCPRCRRQHQWEMWALINAAERPNLFQRARDGEIRHTRCPGCGQDMWLGAPLMLFNPDGFPRAIIITRVEERHLFDALVPAFMEALSGEWRPDDAVVWLPEPIMPFALDQDVRSDLMSITTRPTGHPAVTMYFDFLEQIRAAQRAR